MTTTSRAFAATLAFGCCTVICFPVCAQVMGNGPRPAAPRVQVPMQNTRLPQQRLPTSVNNYYNVTPLRPNRVRPTVNNYYNVIPTQPVVSVAKPRPIGDYASPAQFPTTGMLLDDPVTPDDVKMQDILIASGIPSFVRVGTDWQNGNVLTASEMGILKKIYKNPKIAQQYPGLAAAMQNKVQQDQQAHHAAQAAAGKFAKGFQAGLAAQQAADAQASAAGPADDSQSTAVPVQDSDPAAADAGQDATPTDNDPAAAPAPAPTSAPALSLPAPQQVVVAAKVEVGATTIRICNLTDKEVTYQVKKPGTAIGTLTLAAGAKHDFDAEGIMFIRFTSGGDFAKYTLSPGSCNAFVNDDNGTLDLATLVNE